MVRIFLLFLIPVILTSCLMSSDRKMYDGDKLVIEIKDNEQTINTTDFAQEMRIVRLELTEKSLLSEIRLLKACNNRLYIQDNAFNGIYIFDENGKSLKVFEKSGRGPGEYLYIDDFFIDCENQRIEIFDRQLKKVSIYSLLDFTLINEFAVPLDFAFTFSKVKGLYYFQTNGADNELDGLSTNSDVIAYDPKMKISYPLFNKFDPKTDSRKLEFIDVFIENELEELYISLAGDRTIYKVIEDTVVSYLKIESEFSAPDAVFRSEYDEKMAYLNSDMAKGKKIFFKMLMKKLNSFVVVYREGYPGKICHYFYLDGGKKILHTDNIRNDFLPIPLDGIEIFNEQEGQLLAVVYPANIEDKKLRDYLNITPNDNPLIFKFIL